MEWKVFLNIFMHVNIWLLFNYKILFWIFTYLFKELIWTSSVISLFTIPYFYYYYKLLQLITRIEQLTIMTFNLAFLLFEFKNRFEKFPGWYRVGIISFWKFISENKKYVFIKIFDCLYPESGFRIPKVLNFSYLSGFLFYFLESIRDI